MMMIFIPQRAAAIEASPSQSDDNNDDEPRDHVARRVFHLLFIVMCFFVFVCIYWRARCLELCRDRERREREMLCVCVGGVTIMKQCAPRPQEISSPLQCTLCADGCCMLVLISSCITPLSNTLLTICSSIPRRNLREKTNLVCIKQKQQTIARIHEILKKYHQQSLDYIFY
jgi:hypothetical protein